MFPFLRGKIKGKNPILSVIHSFIGCPGSGLALQADTSFNSLSKVRPTRANFQNLLSLTFTSPAVVSEADLRQREYSTTRARLPVGTTKMVRPGAAPDEAPLGDAVRSMGKELACSICMSLFDEPVKTACNHYFCKACMHAALRVTPACPLCKAPVKRREVQDDARMSGLVRHYRRILDCTNVQSIHCSQSVRKAHVTADEGGAKKRPVEDVDEVERDRGPKVKASEAAEAAGVKRARGGAEPTSVHVYGTTGSTAATTPVEGCEAEWPSTKQQQHQRRQQEQEQEQERRTTSPGGQRSAPARAASRAPLEGWACGTCTLINAAAAGRCAACGGGRPRPSASADAANAARVALEASNDDAAAARRAFAQAAAPTTKGGRAGPSNPRAKSKGKSGSGGRSKGKNAMAREGEVCAFCAQGPETAPPAEGPNGDRGTMGDLVEFPAARANGKPVRAHLACAEWAPLTAWREGVRDSGDSESPALVLHNVASEVTRGRKLKCAECGVSGAVLGCFVNRCRHSYHLPCARRLSGVRFDEANFAMLCPDHANETCLPCDVAGSAEDEDTADEVADAAKTHKTATGEGYGVSSGEATAACIAARDQGRVSLRWPHQPPTWESTTANATVDDAPTRGPAVASVPASGSGSSWSGHRISSEWVIASSGLKASEKNALKRLAARSGAKLVSWDEDVTHVVTHVGDAAGKENMRSKRTLKYLLGVLKGAWVVSPGWVHACLNQGDPVEETLFEVCGDTQGPPGVPARGREYAAEEHEGGHVLSNMAVYLAGAFASLRDMQTLVEAADGYLIEHLPSHSWKDSRQTVIVCDPDRSENCGAGDEAARLRAAAAAGVPVVKMAWLLDSLGALYQQDLGSYTHDCN